MSHGLVVCLAFSAKESATGYNPICQRCGKRKLDHRCNMTEKVKIYGASDDLIEVEGDITEEFNPPYGDDNPCYLAFGDGTMLSVQYDKDGMWRINRLNEGTAAYSKIEATDPDKNYSDVVTLEGDLKFVTFGSQRAVRKARRS